MFNPFKKKVEFHELELKAEFMDWKPYKEKIEMIDLLRFQQRTRQQSVNNTPAPGRGF